MAIFSNYLLFTSVPFSVKTKVTLYPIDKMFMTRALTSRTQITCRRV